jgi:16S rRNA (cytosine967-C5)-methyltransferase
VVCSLFPEEGAQQAERFLQRWPDARAIPLETGLDRAQLLPAQGPMPFREGLPVLHDGFFYALFEKS